MDILDRLAKSKFRSGFKLRAKEFEYIKDKGLEKIKSHAEDFIRDRVALAEPANDGKQTPMRGELTQTEQEYLISIIMEWINRQINSKPVL